MGSLAILARESGFFIGGSDENVYPPMSTQLRSSGIKLYDSYEPSNLEARNEKIIVGNAMKRGQPIIEHILDKQYDYTSGPAWLADNVLSGKVGLHFCVRNSWEDYHFKFASMDP